MHDASIQSKSEYDITASIDIQLLAMTQNHTLHHPKKDKNK